MPWYKAGTVSVTLNSNAVTGVGTAFIVNGRVGDAFRGPDGRWYEVTNVASNTTISIDPPYIGATASGGSYALAPMQGYVKDSADALRAIVNTYGAQLAALKTTGNYDVLPVSKGGTGGKTQGEARTGLGLGSVATDNIVPVTRGGTGGDTQTDAQSGLGLIPVTSTTDSTAGRLLKVGSGGLLGATPLEDATSWLGSRFLAWAQANPTGPSASLISVGADMGYDQARRFQLALNSDALQFRVNTSAAPVDRSGWRKVFDQTNIVGTVSQVGGVPTGAVVQKISNANGKGVRFADGTQICWIETSAQACASSSLQGGFYNATPCSGSYPADFSSPPTALGNAIRSGNTGQYRTTGSEVVEGTATTSPGYRGATGTSGENIAFRIVAFGRWYE